MHISTYILLHISQIITYISKCASAQKALLEYKEVGWKLNHYIVNVSRMHNYTFIYLHVCHIII